MFDKIIKYTACVLYNHCFINNNNNLRNSALIGPNS